MIIKTFFEYFNKSFKTLISVSFALNRHVIFFLRNDVFGEFSFLLHECFDEYIFNVFSGGFITGFL